jgi:hypothetical protein
MADQNDLTHNSTLYDENGNQIGVLNSDVYRLAVDAEITGGNFQLTPFTPEFHYSVAGTSLNIFEYFNRCYIV